MNEQRIEFLGWQDGLGKRGRRRWGEFTYDELAGEGRSTRTMKVILIEIIEGEWPPDEDLITLADGDPPPHKRHFGGSVEVVSENRRRVTVFTD